MSLRIVEATFPEGQQDTVAAILASYAAADASWLSVDGGDHLMRVVLYARDAQEVTDQLQTALGGCEHWRVTILPAEATMPAVTRVGGGSTRQSQTILTFARSRLFNPASCGQ